MKICPKCNSTFEDAVGFCPRDGEVLEEAPTVMVGQVLDGQYEIEAFIARGGMGALYRARHILLGDRVVVKTLRNEMRHNSEWLRRFQREGRAARRFRHPNSVTVYDLRTTNEGMIYMVMEYVEGHTLDKELKKRGRFSPAEALEILEPITSVLNAAHAQGVIHRDLKPENVMLSESADGHRIVKLLDLGIAKLRDVPEASTSPEDGGSLTVVGQLLGTPYYMSPEQWGELPRDGNPEIDGRTDIYSLGVMFYELISGRKPLGGRTVAELRQKHVSAQLPPLHEVAPDVPEAFSRAIERAMSKDRNDRQATAGELADELRAALGLPPMPRGAFATTGSTRSEFATSQVNAQEGAATGVATQERGTSSFAVKEVPAETRNVSPATANVPPPLTTTPTPVLPSVGAEVRPYAAVEAPPRRTPVVLIAGLGVLLLLGGVAGWFAWNSMRAKPVDKPGETNVSSAGNTNSAPAPAAKVEAMRYWLEAFEGAEKGPGRRVAGVPLTLASGKQFRFHFSPRERGYLYIIGPGNANVPTTFLTARPVLGGLKTNQIAANADFSFPYGEGHVLQLDKNPGTEEYTVIFSPTPLVSPSFLAEKALHELTPAEQKELEDFRTLYKANTATSTVQDVNGGDPFVSVSVPSTTPQGQPFIFEIRLEHQ